MTTLLSACGAEAPTATATVTPKPAPTSIQTLGPPLSEAAYLAAVNKQVDTLLESPASLKGFHTVYLIALNRMSEAGAIGKRALRLVEAGFFKQGKDLIIRVAEDLQIAADELNYVLEFLDELNREHGIQQP
jgi:hypothetical protein